MDGFNFLRKLFHWIGFFVPAILFFDLFENVGGLTHASRAILLCILGFILLFMGSIELFRLNHPGFNDFYFKWFGMLMKKAEKDRISGVIPYMLSNAIVVAFFPPQIIFLSMAFLLVGDPFAAFFGSKYGKYRFSNGKSLVGIVAFIIASTLAGLILMIIFQNTFGDSPFSFWKNGNFRWLTFCCIFISAVAAGIAEFFSGHALGGLLEDNLLIPLVSSVLLASFAFFLGEIPDGNIIFPITEIFTQNP
jgi:dolichol kinase